MKDLARRRLRGRGGRGVAGDQEGASSASSTRSSRPEAILATNTSSLSVTEISTANTPARPGDRRPLLQPRAGPEPGRDRPHRRHRAAGARTTSRRWSHTLGKNPVVCGDKAGFIANTLLFGYLNHAVSMYEHRYATREDIDAAMRFGCGYPMGPLALLDLIGLDTAYEILETMYRQGRDRLHAPGADPQADGHRRACSAARPAAASTPTRAPDSPIVVADDADPVGRRQAAAAGTTSSWSAWSAPAPWPPASSRSSPRPGTTSCTSAASDDKVDGVRATIERSLDKAIQRGKLEESAKAEVLGRLTGTTSLDDLGRRRHRGRGDRRGPQGQDHAVREPRRDLQAGRDPGHHDLVAADHRAARRPPSGPRTSSACTSSTRRRS